jgi:hypothetical protein
MLTPVMSAFMPLEALHRAIAIPRTVASPSAPPAPAVTWRIWSPTSLAVSGDSVSVSLAIWSRTVVGSATRP